MENINWKDLSNAEIKLKQLSLKESYENVKNKIVSLLDELDLLDKEYSKGEMEINNRKKN